MIPLILFIISLLSLTALFWYKSWRIRTGNDTSHGSATHAHRHWFSQEELSAIRDRVWKNIKDKTHTVILSTIKTWIILVHIIQKRLREKFPKVFKEPVVTDKAKTTSPFLKTVAEYKTKIKRFKKKIKEQDL